MVKETKDTNKIQTLWEEQGEIFLKKCRASEYESQRTFAEKTSENKLHLSEFLHHELPKHVKKTNNKNGKNNKTFENYINR
jgi:hypothetical protein